MTMTKWDGSGCPIEPTDIDASKHFYNAFDKAEREDAARWLVQFAQGRGKGWEPFGIEDPARFFGVERFNYLDLFGISVPGGKGPAHLELIDDRVHFTVDFVARCYRARPVLREE